MFCMFKSEKNLLLLLLNAKILIWYAIHLILKFFYVLMAAHCEIPLIQDLKNYLRGLFWWPDDKVKVESDEILL